MHGSRSKERLEVVGYHGMGEEQVARREVPCDERLGRCGLRLEGVGGSRLNVSAAVGALEKVAAVDLAGVWKVQRRSLSLSADEEERQQHQRRHCFAVSS